MPSVCICITVHLDPLARGDIIKSRSIVLIVTLALLLYWDVPILKKKK